jgi:hypothetical protein
MEGVPWRISPGWRPLKGFSFISLAWCTLRGPLEGPLDGFRWMGASGWVPLDGVLWKGFPGRSPGEGPVEGSSRYVPWMNPLEVSPGGGPL